MSHGPRRVAGFSALTIAAISAGTLYVTSALHRDVASIPPPSTPAIPLSVALPTAAVALPTAAAPGTAPAPEPRRPAEAVAPVAPPRVGPTPRERVAAASDRSAPGTGQRPLAGVPESPSPIMFRTTALGEMHGRLGWAAPTEPDRAPAVTPLRCERVHFAAGRGVCLTAERRMLASYGAVVFDDAFRPLHQIRLAGAPSRVRVAPDGRHAGITVFVSGHSYAASNFSTRTSILDLRTGEFVVEDLESFAVWRDGQRFHAPDVNFWGVTFARDGNRFYATLGSGGRTYLVEADLARREAHVLRADVECPALSPDNTRVAFKKRIGGLLSPVAWRLSVLELPTGREWELAEPQSVDDQVEWLDDQQVLYALPAANSGTAVTRVWAVPANGGGAPRLVIDGAASPAVVREPLRSG